MNGFKVFLGTYGAFVPRKVSGSRNDPGRYIIDKESVDFKYLVYKKQQGVECIWSVYQREQIIRSGYFEDAGGYIISSRPWKHQNQTFLL